jgi:hypothetical protein
MSGGSGLTSPGSWSSFAHVPGCSCSKTSPGCSLPPRGAPSSRSSRRWPRSGTWDATGLCELATLAPATAASGGSASPGPLLKTPTAQLAVNGGSQHPDKRRAGGHGPTLADEVEHLLLPTPAASDSGNTPANHLGKKPGRRRVTSLKVIVEHGLLLTGGLMPPPSGTGSGG